MIPVVFHRAARLELDEAALWYEERRVDLGIEFIAEVDRCIALIAQHPDLSPVVQRDVRRMTVKRFPYSIYHRRDAERIVVLAIFHGKRDPASWQRMRGKCVHLISRAAMLGAEESEVLAGEKSLDCIPTRTRVPQESPRITHHGPTPGSGR